MLIFAAKKLLLDKLFKIYDYIQSYPLIRIHMNEPHLTTTEFDNTEFQLKPGALPGDNLKKKPPST